ncbi:hypothetical protein HMPREF9628_00196 [Peptoanaerobacter stomatis]|uniref:Uncharacterized protein n=1 Tax=Peptoanaerobacter stomatis TaxID=796937 RepID=G9XBY8_9FIRM|nr:hypothetical protein HMPREF9628_00196 [Peptoanaerobacter stomatis]
MFYHFILYTFCIIVKSPNWNVNLLQHIGLTSSSNIVKSPNWNVNQFKEMISNIEQGIVKSPNWNVNLSSISFDTLSLSNSKITKLECKFPPLSHIKTPSLVIVKSPNWNVNLSKTKSDVIYTDR